MSSKLNSTGRPCYTPDGYDGFCIRLSRCGALYQYYNENRRNPQAVSYFYRSERNCGRNFGYESVICCPNEQPAPTTAEPYYPSPDPVSPEYPQPPPPSPPTEAPTPPPPPPTQAPTPAPTQPPTYPPTHPPTPAPTLAPNDVTNRAGGRACTDPNGLSGECKYIRNCAHVQPKLMEQASRGTVDADFHNYIYKSNVICTGNQVSVPTSDTKLSFFEQQKYFSSHQKSKLLFFRKFK